MSEIDYFIVNLLKSDPVITNIVNGRIYTEIIPSVIRGPFIVIYLNDGREENISPHRSQFFLYLIKAVSDKYADADTLCQRIDSILYQNDFQLPSGKKSFWLSRENIVRYAEYIGNSTYYHLGFYYKIRIAE